MQLMSAPNGMTHQMRRMNSYGFLAAYIPAFAKITGRMQYDLFHAYTVDQHTIFVIRNLRRFALEKHEDEFPFCNLVTASWKIPACSTSRHFFTTSPRAAVATIRNSARKRQPDFVYSTSSTARKPASFRNWSATTC